MSLSDFVSAIQSGFSMLTSAQLFGIPLIAWFVITCMIGLIGLFIKGTKK